jgi:hypothetical protein
MSHEWGSAAIVVAIVAASISFLSAAASLWAASVAHRTLKRQTEADKPIVECQLTPLREHDGWLQLWLTLENPTNVTWTARRLRVVSPTGTIAANWEETHSEDGPGSYKLDENKLAVLTASETTVPIEVLPTGSAAPSYRGGGRGDRNSSWVFVRPPPAATRLKMELSVESRGSVQRMVKYKIVREVPRSGD